MFRSLPILALLAAAAAAQQTYPEGVAIPRHLTAAEAAWLTNHPLAADDVVTPPPTGPLHCAAEYEPMDGLVIAWEGSSSWTAILRQIALHVTTIGQARIYCYVDTASEQATVQSTLAAAGCDMSRVVFLVRTTDSIWCRDYGPRYVYEGDCRVIVDHTYNRPRPNDNAVPAHFGPSRGHRVYEIPLVHGGGNFHLDALGRGRATLLIANENPGLSTQQIQAHWQAYQGLQTTLYTPFPTTVDATQHIDMWMQVFADQSVMVSDWPLQPGSTQDQICDAAAAALMTQGITVHRVPAFSVGGTHYTYTNMVLCNNLALVPSYTNTTVAPYNAQALAAWQAALPGKTVLSIPCQGIVTAAGVMHCIVMHVPAHRGGQTPTAYLKSPNGGEALAAFQQVEVQWNADDDDAVVAVDLQLSVNGGATFPYTLATGLPHTGSWIWSVPDLHAPNARLRVVAHDAQGRVGSDRSDADFAITGTGCRADATPYGNGKPGSLGVPALSATAPILGTAAELRLDAALPQAGFLLLMGNQAASSPFDGGTMLVSATSGLIAFADAAGSWRLPIPLPDEPALCGFTLRAQVWIPNDPLASGAGWAASNGLAVVLGH
ncbi:MAG: hypothetical protein RL398_129 [Planctomycetota bacterium]